MTGWWLLWAAGVAMQVVAVVPAQRRTDPEVSSAPRRRTAGNTGWSLVLSLAGFVVLLTAGYGLSEEVAVSSMTLAGGVALAGVLQWVLVRTLRRRAARPR